MGPRIKIAALAFLGFIATAAAAAAALPGPQRALCPQCYGLSPIGGGIFTDAPHEADRLRALVETANRSVEVFFGTRGAAPRIILCTEAPCHQTFGSKPRGLTFGYHLVLIAPKGINRTIVTHELVHAELHRFMDIGDLWHQRFPAWFDEGLATLLSDDDRIDPAPPAADIAWIKSARNFRDWGRFIREREDWRPAYSAAAAAVGEIEARIGRYGLMDLIRDVAAGTDFDTALARIGANG